MITKGIILAGGTGSRLYPVTKTVSKQLLPIYDKPMIYYPLSCFMHAGIKDILIITTLVDQPLFSELLGDGSHLGINIQYATQLEPKGIAQAFSIANHCKFIDNEPCALILGDNIFYGHDLPSILKQVAQNENNGSTIFAHRVSNPERYGVVSFNKDGKVLSIQEKPKKPHSNFAITGLYFYDKNAVEYAKKLKPSERGEYEITDLNKKYLKKKNLHVQILGRGITWFDTGTHDSMLQASQFVQVVEERQGLKISCPEEIAYLNGWITAEQVEEIGSSMENNQYGQYLLELINA